MTISVGQEVDSPPKATLTIAAPDPLAVLLEGGGGDKEGEGGAH